jgi:hypothetical protein
MAFHERKYNLSKKIVFFLIFHFLKKNIPLMSSKIIFNDTLPLGKILAFLNAFKMHKKKNAF